MTSTFSFNLLDEPWIPCLRVDGAAVELSLRDTLAQAHTLQMVADDAPQTTAALLRLLLAVAHRVFGPKNRAAWRALWQADALDAAKLDAYFDQWRHRFDLFHAERPFYQVDDPSAKYNSVITLKDGFGMETNKDRHFDHTEPDIVLTPAQAARGVVTVHTYGLGGTAGNGTSFTGGPAMVGVAFFVTGSSLKETLLLNMPPYPKEGYFYRTSDEDAPAWEQDDFWLDDRTYPTGLLDYLTWQGRMVLLHPIRLENGDVMVDSCKIRPGTRLDAKEHEPYFAYRRDKNNGLRAVGFSENRQLWRDSAALFSLTKRKRDTYVAPKTMEWLSALVYEEDDTTLIGRQQVLNCSAFGIARDPGQAAKVLFARAEHLMLPAAYLDPDNEKPLSQLESALAYAEQVGQDLLFAARIAGMHLFVGNAETLQWQQVGKNTKDDINNWVTHSGVERAYWAALDVPFQSLLLRLPAAGADALLAWQGLLRDTAQAALEAIQAYGPGDGRSLKAWVHGQRTLAGRLRKTLPQLYPPPETTTPDGGAVGPDGDGPLDAREIVNQDVDDDNSNHDPDEEENA